MKFSEAMKALEMGKKVKMIGENFEEVVEMDGRGRIFTLRGTRVDLGHRFWELEWKLYEENPEPLYQWRFVNHQEGGTWFIDDRLMTKQDANDDFSTVTDQWEIHAGPFYSGCNR